MAAPLPNLGWERYLPLAVAVSACLLLLTAVAYCPTYQPQKLSLLGLYFDGFGESLWQELLATLGLRPGGSAARQIVASEWIHCAFVPPLVAYLIYRQRVAIRAAVGPGHALGYVLLAAGLLLYLLGFLMENYYAGVIALELVYGGLIALFWGLAVLRRLLFPLGFLLFMWPYRFLETAAFHLRLAMSSLSHHLLDLFGIANQLHGTALLSPPGSNPAFAVDIADPCSGIRSLFAVLMIATLYGHLAFTKVGPQLVLGLSAIPLVVVGNLARIILLVLASRSFGAEFALGSEAQPSWFHEGAGFLVYAIDLVGLGLIGALAQRIEVRLANRPLPP